MSNTVKNDFFFVARLGVVVGFRVGFAPACAPRSARRAPVNVNGRTPTSHDVVARRAARRDGRDGRRHDAALGVARLGARVRETARDRRARGGDVARSHATHQGESIYRLGALGEVCDEATGAVVRSGQGESGERAVERGNAGVEGEGSVSAHAAAGCDTSVFDYACKEVLTGVVGCGDRRAGDATGKGDDRGDGGDEDADDADAGGFRIWFVFGGATVSQRDANGDVSG